MVKSLGRQVQFPLNKYFMIFQITGIYVTPSVNSPTNVTVALTPETTWPAELVLTLQQLQAFSPSQLIRHFTKNVKAPVIKSLMNYFNLPLQSKKSENIAQLVPTILPNSLDVSQQQRVDSFLHMCELSNCSSKPEHHDIYTTNFNAVDLGDKIYYHGGKPAFLTNCWTQREYMFIVRLLVNNAWMIHELWEVMDLGTFRENVAVGLLNMTVEDLIKWL